MSLTGLDSPRWLSLAISTWARPASSTGTPASHTSQHHFSHLCLGGPDNFVIVKTMWLLGTISPKKVRGIREWQVGWRVQHLRSLTFMTLSLGTMGSHVSGPDLQSLPPDLLFYPYKVLVRSSIHLQSISGDHHLLIFPIGWTFHCLQTLAVVSEASTHSLSDDFLNSHRFCKNVFDRDYKATIGVDFEIERFEISGIPYSLQM